MKPAPFPPVLRIVATAALAVAAFLGATRLVSGLGPLGLDPRGDLFPFYAPEILRAAPLKVRIFNDFNFGGYLAWSLGPEPTIFMDGHFSRDTAALSQYLHVVRAKPGWEPILEFHDLNAIVIRPLNLVSGGLPPIVAAVANHPGWSLVHVDPAAVIYLRRDLVEKDPSLKAVTEYVRIEPVLKETEGQEVTLREGFDPSTVRLTGNVIGPPPFTGTLRHSGWRVVSTSIPPIPKSQDSRDIEPAEVEIS